MGEELSCSFCGRMKTQTEVLIAGLDAHICDQCVEQANGIILNESKNTEASKSSFNLESPVKIKSYLDQYVIGQNYAKKVLSVAVYNHYKRIINKDVDDSIEIQKSNVLICFSCFFCLIRSAGYFKTLRVPTPGTVGTW